MRHITLRTPNAVMFSGTAIGLFLVLLVRVDASQQPAAAAVPFTPQVSWMTPSLATQPATFRQESIEIKLAPREGMEYKYRVDKGGSFLYSWNATSDVHYELHSEPTGAPRGYAESFDKHDSRNNAHGSFSAPYPGIHGWYWENRSANEVTIKLTSAGFYTASLEFRRGMDVKTKVFE